MFETSEEFFVNFLRIDDIENETRALHILNGTILENLSPNEKFIRGVYLAFFKPSNDFVQLFRESINENNFYHILYLLFTKAKKDIFFEFLDIHSNYENAKNLKEIFNGNYEYLNIQYNEKCISLISSCLYSCKNYKLLSDFYKLQNNKTEDLCMLYSCVLLYVGKNHKVLKVIENILESSLGMILMYRVTNDINFLYQAVEKKSSDAMFLLYKITEDRTYLERAFNLKNTRATYVLAVELNSDILLNELIERQSSYGFYHIGGLKLQDNLIEEAVKNWEIGAGKDSSLCAECLINFFLDNDYDEEKILELIRNGIMKSSIETLIKSNKIDKNKLRIALIGSLQKENFQAFADLILIEKNIAQLLVKIPNKSYATLCVLQELIQFIPKQDHLRKKLYECYISLGIKMEKGRITDFKLIGLCNGEKIEKFIHKFVLNSEFFDVFFEGEFSECNELTIELNEISSLDKFIEYLYLDKIEQIQDNNIFDLTMISDRFMINDLKLYVEISQI